jgi:hypothetical protein
MGDCTDGRGGDRAGWLKVAEILRLKAQVVEAQQTELELQQRH